MKFAVGMLAVGAFLSAGTALGPLPAASAAAAGSTPTTAVATSPKSAVRRQGPALPGATLPPPAPANPANPVVIPATPPGAPTVSQSPTTPLVTTPTPPPPALPTAIDVPPPVQKPAYLPFPNLPAVPLDENNDGVGIAQQMTRSRGLQARMLWIDATANLSKVNTAEKIAALVSKIKSVGFNTIVFDVKPIIGYTLYPSKYAPKMTEWARPWGTQTLPSDFDPLKEMVAQAHAQGLGLIVNMNMFSEGHREFKTGPGYDHPEWQTVYYEVQTKIRRSDVSGTPSYPITDRANMVPRSPDDLALYSEFERIPANTGNDALLCLIDGNGSVGALMTAGALKQLQPTLPPGGAVIVGTTPPAIAFLRVNALPGYRLGLDDTPIYVPISQRPEKQVPLMTNPNNPEVRQRLLDMLTEVATNYPVDGFIFDDRLRYAALNADFSDITKRQFEQYLQGAQQLAYGKTLNWPDDVFRYDIAWPSMDRSVIPGPYYEAWLTFRALTLRNFFADTVRAVKTVRPQATVSTYVGSWYPDYPDLGANWGADDLQAGFHFLNDSYRKTGWAGLADFIVTGCYYPTATILEAAQKGIDVGQSVEAAGQFSNRAVNDQTFVYAGISLDQFKGRPDALQRVLQAAAATTQGIMCFDLSHDIDPLWPIFQTAFQKPAVAPHQVPGLVNDLRARHAADKAAGVPTPPVILYRGASGTGF